MFESWLPLTEKSPKTPFYLVRALVLLVIGSMVFETWGVAQENKESERFKNFEIRVIRPRYFSKKGRLELGSQVSAVTNQTFIYTYMISGILDYHFTEELGLEFSAAFGFSLEKDDQKLLAKDFGITTQILRTSSMLMTGAVWTPIYGKFQLASGELVYFDTFVGSYFGMTGIDYQFDHCEEDPGDENNAPRLKPNPVLKNYPTIGVGIGQRFFLSKSSSIRWDIREQMLSYDEKDGACDTGVASKINTHHNVTIQFGYTYFL